MNFSRALLALLCALGATACTRTPDFSRPLSPSAPVRSASFREGMNGALGASFTAGNRITTYHNGAEIFPALLAGIESARSTVNMEMFVFEHGTVPERFAEALAAKARQGVQVRVLLDAVGAKKSARYHDTMRDAGVQLELHHRIWSIDPRRINYRTHRKLLIVDGRIGFIGGVGIADHWDGQARGPDEWREMHYRVEGSVVAQLQGAFLENWVNARGELLQGPAFFPAPRHAGSSLASAFHASPRRERFAAELMFHLALASAQRSVRIVNPYFIPDPEMSEALCAAARRGVRVQIILPGEYMDQKGVQRASRKRWSRLLAAGVELYEYDPTMIHIKLLIVDEHFVSIGSSNLDPRSLRINDEANLNVLDDAFAREQTRYFFRDLSHSRRVPPDGVPPRLTELPVQVLQAPLESQL